ncbi:cytochrome P450 2D10-like [Periophthalmus magnuspinnatus]|uniref:cytochrome P450 2D10-like n=1 Tax=Periophthalmus magnuspinnatus TaxID=409849 RepID=UPI002436C082|nr:cytochrome P450 2D10-like [Periophthalmus magnuspinnatus]
MEFSVILVNLSLPLPLSLSHGPWPLPVFGNLLELNLDSPTSDLQRLAKRYGSIYSLKIGSKPAVVLNGLQAIKEALVNKSEDFSATAPGVVLSDYGPGWREQRRFGLMTLRNFGLGKQSMENRILQEIDRIVRVLEQSTDKPFNPKMIFHNAASSVICQVLFAKQFDYEDEFMKFFVGLFHETSKIINGRWGMIYDSIPMDAHERRMEILAENKNTRVPGKPRHFIDSYLDEIDKRGEMKSSFTEDQLSAFLLDLHFAGTDTTANTLLSAFLYLMNYPRVQEHCQQEIDRVLDGKRQATFEDRHLMPYTQGTMVIPNLSSVLSEEGQWKFPRGFHPENFLDDQGEFVKPEAFMPFSAGPRMCLGEGLARMELFLITVTLLRKFKFIWPEDAGEPDYTPVFGSTQTPKPYHMKVQMRTTA